MCEKHATRKLKVIDASGLHVIIDPLQVLDFPSTTATAQRLSASSAFVRATTNEVKRCTLLHRMTMVQHPTAKLVIHEDLAGPATDIHTDTQSHEPG